MDEEIRRTIEAIHASPWQCAVAVTGAGSEALAWLLAVPGASATLLEGLIPYAEAAFVEFLGERPAHFSSLETASLMAGRALARSEHLRPGEVPVLGVGCTGALATNRPKRGEHRVCVGLQSAGERAVTSLTLTKGARTREQEEEVASRLLIYALALACSVLPAFAIPLLPGEQVVRDGDLSPVADLLAGRVASLLVRPDGRAEADAPWAGGILAGAFNPLHAGHERLAAAAGRLLGAPVAYELSVRNVDKPPLSEEEVLRRARQMSGRAALLLTCAPTFREKARLFPGATFVIGYDTAVRLVAPRYYAGEADMLAALEEIRALGCRFLVAGRLVEGAYHTLDDAVLPPGFEGILQQIPEAEFREDISSTELRG